MRHPDLEITSLLNAARAARELKRNATSAQLSVADAFSTVAATRALALVEIILDHEDRLADFHEHWKRWRRARSS